MQRDEGGTFGQPHRRTHPPRDRNGSEFDCRFSDVKRQTPTVVPQIFKPGLFAGGITPASCLSLSLGLHPRSLCMCVVQRGRCGEIIRLSFCVFPYCKSYSREVHRMCGPQVCGGWENNLSRGASFSTRPRPPPLSVPQIFYLLRFGGSGRPHLSNFVCRRRGDRPVSLPLFSPPACSQARILKVERWQPWWQELVGNQTRDDVNSGFYNSFPEGE